MANTKISALTSATTPLAGTEVLPIVQSSATVKVATNDLTVRNIRANATTGILQVTGPTAGTTRVVTVPDANFTAARTDAAQSFTGSQTLSTGSLIISTSGQGIFYPVTSGGTALAPAFSASLSGNQTVTASTTTKLTFNTEQFDTNSNYDNATNYRFTPTVAGYYQINVTLDFADASVAIQDVLARLYKNGAQYLAPIRVQTGAGKEVGITIAQLVSMNGSTDYLEVYFQQVSGTNVVVYANSNFCGSLVRAA